MPTAAEMQATSSSVASQSPIRRESTAYSTQPSQSPIWQSEGPYAAPTQNAFGSGGLQSNVNYSTPGAFLLGVSALNLIYDLLWSGLFALGAIQDNLDADAIIGFAAFFIWAILSIACHAMTFIAGWKMMQRQSLSTARFGAILGLVPCGVCFVFQIPFAIWAVVVLYRAEAPTDFEAREN